MAKDTLHQSQSSQAHYGQLGQKLHMRVLPTQACLAVVIVEPLL